MNFKNKNINYWWNRRNRKRTSKKSIELGGRVLATGTKIDKLDELKKILTEF